MSLTSDEPYRLNTSVRSSTIPPVTSRSSCSRSTTMASGISLLSTAIRTRWEYASSPLASQ
ncbi:hypothetical protein D3C78_1889970 [compost metagenome]